MCKIAGMRTTTCGEFNPGGFKRVWLIASDNFHKGRKGWPCRSDVVAGVITATPVWNPSLTEPAEFAEFEVADNSCKVVCNVKGRSGAQSWDQAIEARIFGMYPEQIAALNKLMNTGVVIVAEDNDGRRFVLGNSVNALEPEIGFDSGMKGTDERGWTLKYKGDGYGLPATPISDLILLPGIPA